MKSSYNPAHREAENFLNNEKQFHLGIFCPTKEQSNPKTRNIDLTFKNNPADGVRLLLSVDRDIQATAARILSSKEFHEMVDAGIRNTIARGGKIVFSGCGSTGRLSILLEAMWRYYFRDLRNAHPGYIW